MNVQATGAAMEVRHNKLKIGKLKRLERFRSSDKGGIPAYLPKEAIPGDQILLGVYENVPGSKSDAVVVTDTSIWFEQSGQLSEVRYADIKSVRSSPESKRSANSLILVTADGSGHVVKILGRDADGADVFVVETFLIHAIPQ